MNKIKSRLTVLRLTVYNGSFIMPIYYIPKKDFKIVESNEIKPYIESTQDDEVRITILIAWLTGARIQEIVNMKKEDITIDEEYREVNFLVKALKFGKTGFPTIGFNDPFVMDFLIPYLRRLLTNDIVSRCKRVYQNALKELNKKIHGDDKSKYITFHYLRHSRLAWMGRKQRAFPEEFKSWTGHQSSAFEDYFAPSRTKRFKDKIT